VYIDDPNCPHGWLDYEYVIWGDAGKDLWISIFDKMPSPNGYKNNCIFVGKPSKLQTKYGE